VQLVVELWDGSGAVVGSGSEPQLVEPRWWWYDIILYQYPLLMVKGFQYVTKSSRAYSIHTQYTGHYVCTVSIHTGTGTLSKHS
jgi:hypothetical protein